MRDRAAYEKIRVVSRVIDRAVETLNEILKDEIISEFRYFAGAKFSCTLIAMNSILRFLSSFLFLLGLDPESIVSQLKRQATGNFSIISDRRRRIFRGQIRPHKIAQ